MGRRFKDITGQSFGKLTAVERVEGVVPTSWLCKCECGNEKVTALPTLLKEHIKSCGCAAKGRRVTDLTGNVYEKLTVISRAENSSRGSAQWLCKCECGGEKVVTSAHLTQGSVRSCGCLYTAASSLADISGLQFGMLLARRRVHVKTSVRPLWLCKCNCGRTCYKRRHDLLSGKVKSCGCLRDKRSKSGETLTREPGRRFGKLVLVEVVGKDAIGGKVWRCKCDCGREIEKRSSCLNSNTRSCGKCIPRKRNRRDLTGLTFGRLTGVKELGKHRSGHYQWQCECECGNTHIVKAGDLTSGHVKSCGCLRKDASVKEKRHERFSPTYIPCEIEAEFIKMCRDSRISGYHICASWEDNALQFYKDLGKPPSDKHQLKRIDLKRGFFKENMQWER